ncbi:MAG: hypothetical protein NDI73_10750 [Desulfuromonadales bacterium]|nr:hypothetical protein [Desulfuromonadales bacterium]
MALLVLLAGPRPVQALGFQGHPRKPLNLELEWRYADYSSESSTGEDFEASHFVQKYSALYQLAGNLYNGKGGSYNLGLGFEWWSLDTTFGDADFSLSNFKPLYNGDLYLAPGGLPFRLHLFAHDKESAGFFYRDHRQGVLNSNIITDVSDGSHHTLGATLIAGIRNGSYAGQYREYMSQVPKLYVDFRQDLVRDLEGATPEHYLDRNLAFVSLNKKDNWFHYRLHDFEDYVDKRNNFTEKTFLLGTVDHLNYRQWIWLTNWVKLSTDASFTTIEEPYRDPNPEEIFDFNLFFNGKKDGLAFSNPTTFSRTRQGGHLEKDLSVPVFLTQTLSPDRQAYVQMILEREEDSFADFPAADTASDDVYLSGKLATGMTKPLRFDPQLELEFKEGTLGRGQSARAGVELYTNSRYRTDTDWLLAYSVGSYRGTPAGDDAEDVDFLEQIAEASVSRQFNPNLRVGGDQKVVVGRGELNSTVSKRIQPESSDSWLEDNDDAGDTDISVADTLRTITKLFADHRRGRLANRLLLKYEYLKVNDQEDQMNWELSHRLGYVNGNFRVKMINELEIGDQVGERSFSAPRIGTSLSTSGSTDSDITFEHETFAAYMPNQNWFVDGLLNYMWRDGEQERNLLSLRQKAQYNFFHTNGRKRRWLEVQQNFDFERSWGDEAGIERTYGNFTLGGKFYPMHNTYLRGYAGYEWYDPGITYVTYGAGIGVNFPLFQVEANYEYGTGDDDDTGEDIVDHRWELNIKKLI